MPIDQRFITPRARTLGSTLRKLRIRSGLTGRDLGRQLGISHSAVSHWEKGRRVPAPEETASALTVLGVYGEEKRRLVELARHAGEPDWFSVGLNGASDRMDGVVECERAATHIVDWAVGLVTGLLQTADYRRAILLCSGQSAGETERATQGRLDRKEVLTRRRSPVRLHAVLSEAALRNEIGGPWIMADQYRYLIEMGNRPNVTVQVVPINSGWHPGTAGPFVLYDFDGAPSVVYFEHHRSSAFDPDPDDVAVYRDATRAILERAHSPEETGELLRQLAADADDREPENAHAEVAQIPIQPAE